MTDLPRSPGRWVEQNLGVPLAAFLIQARAHVLEDLALTGKFDLRTWDHGHKEYRGNGRSNKQVIIFVAKMLGRDPESMDEVRLVFANLIFG